MDEFPPGLGKRPFFIALFSMIAVSMAETRSSDQLQTVKIGTEVHAFLYSLDIILFCLCFDCNVLFCSCRGFGTSFRSLSEFDWCGLSISVMDFLLCFSSHS